MNDNPLLRLATAGYRKLILFASSLQSVFLLIIRLYWGWQFHTTGVGKLNSISKIADYFQSLGIPLPELNAYIAGTTECVGGLLLLLGIASRITTIPLIIVMIVAYMTAMPEVVKNIFHKPDDFVTADPFLYMLAAIIVFLFGPGLFSVDGLIAHLLKRKNAVQSAAAPAP